MGLRRFDIVVTTILEPAWLAGYLENISEHGHTEAVTIRIICDRKSPASVYEAASQAAAQGFAIDCPDLDEQATYLRSLGLDDTFIPYDSDNRRNVGFLRAWESNADVLISIDDDNYCRRDSDFIRAHDVVGRPCEAPGEVRFASGSEWLNPCSLSHTEDERTIYARGFPYSARQAGHEPALIQLPDAVGDQIVAVNAGLWLEDPDVDAITRLALRPHVTAVDRMSVILGPATWAPVNTQNTAVHRAAIPAYYYVRMGFPLRGMRIDRFGDIWSGYFLQACARALDEMVRVGVPVSDHRRTSHNLFLDLHQELAGIVLTEDLLPWLRELRLTSNNYLEAYAELAESLAEQAGRFKGFIWDDGGQEFLVQTAENMRTWLGAVKALTGA